MPITVSTETNLAPRKPVHVAHEAIKAPYEPKTTSSKAMWVAKSTISSLDLASYEAKIVSDHEAISALRRG